MELFVFPLEANGIGLLDIPTPAGKPHTIILFFRSFYERISNSKADDIPARRPWKAWKEKIYFLDGLHPPLTWKQSSIHY
jgi:hypothetical protein